MGRNIWRFMETECRNSIKKPFKIFQIAEVVLSEQFFVFAKTVKPYRPSPVAVAIGIVPHVSRTKPINGSTDRWKISCPPIISS